MDKHNPNAIPMKSTVTIEPKYADDITYTSTSKPYIDNIKETIPSKLKMYIGIPTDSHHYFYIVFQINIANIPYIYEILV